jgi:ketosteroid isomerase-like protein
MRVRQEGRMKLYLRILLIGFSTLATQVAATVAGPEIKATGQVNQDSKSAELVALTNDWMEAINKKDRSKLEALMAPDYALYGWNGELWAPRSVWLDNLYHHIEIQHYEHRDIAAYVYGDFANVTSIADWRGSMNGKPFNEVDLVVDTWRQTKTNGKWQVVSRTSHAEPVKTSSTP